MPWYNDDLANPMGYEYCVLFDCARDALKAWPFGIALPGNICRSVYQARPDAMLREVDQDIGLATDCPVHLYGYQSPAGQDGSFALSLDPLMTGWIRHLKTDSAIISFGQKKMISLGYGGAFLTNDESLVLEMERDGHWNDRYTVPLMNALDGLVEQINRRWEVMGWWDRYLGDSLMRIPIEQLMPWRVMRRAFTWDNRNAIVRAMREAGYDIGTNYIPLEGSNEWGDTILNFFCTSEMEKATVRKACEIVKRAARPWA